MNKNKFEEVPEEQLKEVNGGLPPYGSIPEGEIEEPFTCTPPYFPAWDETLNEMVCKALISF